MKTSRLIFGALLMSSSLLRGSFAEVRNHHSGAQDLLVGRCPKYSKSCSVQATEISRGVDLRLTWRQ